MARRRSSFFEDFMRGYDAAGQVLSDWEVSKLEDAEVESVDRGLNLKSDGEQAAMLNAQNAEFGDEALDAGRQTAMGLRTVDKQADPMKVGQEGFRYLDKTYDKTPGSEEMEFQRGLRSSDIYQKYGQRQAARTARSDAYNTRTADMQYRGLKRKDDIDTQLAELNANMYAAMQGDEQGIEGLFKFAQPVYNDPNVKDDPNSMSFVNGRAVINDPNGQGQFAGDMFKKLPPEKQQELLMRAHVYGKAAITGDYSQIMALQDKEADRALKREELALDREYKGAYSAYLRAKAKGDKVAAKDWQVALEYESKGQPMPYALWMKLGGNDGVDDPDQAYRSYAMSIRERATLGGGEIPDVNGVRGGAGGATSKPAGPPTSAGFRGRVPAGPVDPEAALRDEIGDVPLQRPRLGLPSGMTIPQNPAATSDRLLLEEMLNRSAR